MTLSPLGVSALALLNERPMHPYEMYQLILDRHEDRIVRVSPGTLYRTVERLDQEGRASVVGTGREGNRPERTTYEITDLGRQSLVDRLREILRAPVNEFPHFVLALAEAHNLARTEVIEDLTEHVSTLDTELAELDHLLAGAVASDIPEIYYVEGSYLRDMFAAQRAWLTSFITRLEKDDVPWPSKKP